MHNAEAERLGTDVANSLSGETENQVLTQSSSQNMGDLMPKNKPEMRLIIQRESGTQGSKQETRRHGKQEESQMSNTSLSKYNQQQLEQRLGEKPGNI